jgi:predicted transcriptional regulator
MYSEKGAITMEDKDTYTIQELYDELTVTLTDLARQADLNEVTIARIRDGKPVRRLTINRLLRALSEIYGRPLSLRNVTGINVQVNKRVEKREARKEANAA